MGTNPNAPSWQELAKRYRDHGPANAYFLDDAVFRDCYNKFNGDWKKFADALDSTFGNLSAGQPGTVQREQAVRDALSRKAVTSVSSLISGTTLHSKCIVSINRNLSVASCMGMARQRGIDIRLSDPLDYSTPRGNYCEWMTLGVVQFSFRRHVTYAEAISAAEEELRRNGMEPAGVVELLEFLVLPTALAAPQSEVLAIGSSKYMAPIASCDQHNHVAVDAYVIHTKNFFPAAICFLTIIDRRTV